MIDRPWDALVHRSHIPHHALKHDDVEHDDSRSRAFGLPKVMQPC